MIKTVYEKDFVEAFKTLRPDDFSFKGLKALYKYLEGYEEITEANIELDVIDLCCTFTEYKNFKDFQTDNPNVKSLNKLKHITTVILIEDSEGFIIQDF